MTDNLNRTCKDCNFYFTPECPNQNFTTYTSNFLAINCEHFHEKETKKTLDETLKDLTQLELYKYTETNNKRNCFQCINFNTTPCKYYKLPFRMNTAEYCDR